jgi:hypothetical protein
MKHLAGGQRVVPPPHIQALRHHYRNASARRNFSSTVWFFGWLIGRRARIIAAMKIRYGLLLLGAALAWRAAAAPVYPDRWVWVFGWNLEKDGDTAEIEQMLASGAAHGINGAVVSFGLDALCKKSPEFFRRLETLQQTCARLKIELIPSVFSIGYGGGLLAHDRHLAEGLPVVDAPFVVHGNVAQFVPDETVRLANGDFEKFKNNKFKGFNFHDEPGVVSFADTAVKHGGAAALRLENFTANPHGHGRIMQEVRVRPHRCYRLSAWVKTEELNPTHAFMLQVLAGDRSIAPREFNLPATTDWRKLTMIFNSLSNETVRIYAGMWGGKSGKLWLDDWQLEEIGPLNVLHRPGTPVAVRSADGATTYVEGRDYAPLVDPHFNPYRVPEGAGVPLRLLPGTRIADGQRLRVSWYHSMLIHDSQVSLCMAEPKLYEIMEEEAQLLAQHLHPRRVLLSMDEVRMGGTCAACRGKDMAALIGECVTRQADILRRHIPGVELLVWSDMFDPHHNAHGNYFLVEGDYTGSWKHIPKDLTIAVWGGEPREKNLKFFADEGFATVCCCYYDADDLQSVSGWIKLAQQTRNVRGFMYTPWQKKYGLLPAFGDLLLQARPAAP